jgi:hypothetical protein
MRLRDELEEGCTGVSVGAAAHGWHALPFPLAPFRSHTGSGRGDVGAGANAWWPAHAMVGYARYEPHATSGFLIRLLGLLHTGDEVNKSYRQASGTCLRSFTQGRI